MLSGGFEAVASLPDHVFQCTSTSLGRPGNPSDLQRQGYSELEIRVGVGVGFTSRSSFSCSLVMSPFRFSILQELMAFLPSVTSWEQTERLRPCSP